MKRLRLWLAVCAATLLVVMNAATRIYSARAFPACPAPPRRRRAPPTPPSTTKKPAFALLWTTREPIGHVTQSCLESIFYHHPDANVSIYSNTLAHRAVAPLQARGYAIAVRRYDVTALLSSTPAEPWLERLEEWQRGPYFYSHLTDALRLALLWRDGGVYLDSDVLLVRPLRLPESPVTLARPAPDGLSGELRNALGVESRAGEQTSQQVLNGAVLVFDAESPFLWQAMHEFAAKYMADRWGWNGPELLTRVSNRCGGASVQPVDSFYPLHWQDVAMYAGSELMERQQAMWETISRRSYAVHLWNRKSSALTLHPQSVLGRLLVSWKVLPKEGWSAEAGAAL